MRELNQNAIQIKICSKATKANSLIFKFCGNGVFKHFPRHFGKSLESFVQSTYMIDQYTLHIQNKNAKIFSNIKHVNTKGQPQTSFHMFTNDYKEMPSFSDLHVVLVTEYFSVMKLSSYLVKTETNGKSEDVANLK